MADDKARSIDREFPFKQTILNNISREKNQLTLQRKALAFIPKEMQEAALEPDDEPIPSDIVIPTDTPPIEDYDVLKSYQDTSKV